MAQEKPTSIRVLQSNKKKSRSPVIYIIIGIIAGVFVSISLFLFLSQPYSSDPTTVESKSNQDQERDPVLMTNSSTHGQVAVDQQEQADPMSHDGFEQPKENELSGIFKPAPHKNAAPTQQRVSPFDAQLTGERVAPKQQVVAKPTQPIQPAQQKPIAQPKVVQAKPAEAKKVPVEPEAEAETPKASVDIKVTRSPFAVN
ncbi:hypothetical protein [Acinetobacter nosocomialis]|jgi:hypothetical protein|uniref:hypothetical protein n=1 Tax=Acinetobacter nosocomialis TaxID=106654 RepID=UPI0003B2A937|nr:hypothetical protein [Acinetobacter nosocomialis]MBR7717209.1 hypothetical protein [Acinetobacter nosocomialis]OTT91992.1 hypothetical protein CAT69_12985 [Acinetobacter nosocomialis]QCP62946.1 hypothetical protein FDQ49_03020 [Acinetobacter nosocomialis M2]